MLHKDVIEALCVVLAASLTNERLCVYDIPPTPIVKTLRADVSIFRFDWRVYVYVEEVILCEPL